MLAQNYSPFALSDVKAVTIRLHPGEDLKAQLDEYVKANHLKAACIITCVGSLQQVAIRFANQSVIEIISGKFEILSLAGTFADSASHLHILISDSVGKTIGGHLKEGSIVYTTAEIVIGILPAVLYERAIDPTFGFKELMIKRADG
ncbi:MAG TPA: PPC domain-containing DNA-binding protein [Segetibacter sp.]